MKKTKTWVIFTLLLTLISNNILAQTWNPATDSDFHLVWQDNFNTLNTNKWKAKHMFDHYGEPQVYLDSNVFVNNGKLNIVLQHEHFHAPSNMLDSFNCFHQLKYGTDYEYTSGWLESKSGFDVRVNSYVEARIKSPYLKSMNSAFWLFKSESESKTTDYNEIDIVEILGWLGKDTVTSNIHWNSNDSNQKKTITFDDLGIIGNYCDTYITYGALYRSDSIIFYINHKRSGAYVNKGQMNAQRIIFSTALRQTESTGIIRNPYDSIRCPDTMHIDYVRVYDYNSDTTYSTNYLKPPYLINPLNYGNTGNLTQMQIMWQLNDYYYNLSGGYCRVDIQTATGYVISQQIVGRITSDNLYSHVVTTLPKGYKYYYRIWVLDAAGNPISDQPFPYDRSMYIADNNSNTKFYAYGDTRGYSDGNSPNHLNSVCATIVDEIAADPQSQTLLLHAGDWNNSDRELDWNNEYFASNDTSATKLRSIIATMGVKGNHEVFSDNQNRVFEGKNFKKYYPFPYRANYKTGNDFSYNFDYGDVHFVMIYVNNDGYNLSNTEKQWLDYSLANTDKKWKVIMFHAPVKTLRAGLASTSTIDYVKQKAKQYGVQAVIMGHEHYYAHWVEQGTHYMILGGAGSYIGGVNLDSLSASNEVFVSTLPHFAKFETQNDIMLVDVIQGGNGPGGDYNGKRIEKYSIPISTQITDTVVFNNPINYPIISDIINIEEGGELIINSTVKMIKNGKIIVKPKGKLLFQVDSAIISSHKSPVKIIKFIQSNGEPSYTNYDEAEQYWQGIEVWGDPTKNQLYENGRAKYQGEVIIKGGATIKNAKNALWASKMQTDGMHHDWGHGGGILRLDSAYFINNKFDVWIGAYHNNNSRNLSFIKNSHFENNDDMLANENAYAFVGLWDAGLIDIRGNKFINLKTNQETKDKGRGVILYNSTINLRDYCPSTGSIYTNLTYSQATSNTPCIGARRNYFEGLYYGIKASSVTGYPNSFINIDRAEFKNVYHGIHILNTKYAVLTRNDFKIANTDPAASNNPDLYDAYGLYLDGSDAYRVEENYFDKIQSNQGIRGIVINGATGNNNELYRNTFKHLGYSIQPQETNRNIAGDHGLGIYCNTLDSNAYDIAVLDSGIAENQKIFNTAQNNNEPYFAAGNLFSNDNNNYMNYYNDAKDANGGMLAVNYYPDYANIPQRVFKVGLPQDGSYLSRSCPIKLYNMPLPTLVTGEIPTLKIALNSALTILNIWRDGGKADLDEQVKTTQPWDIYVEFNHLIAESPYLSDDVLLEVIHNSAFTSLMIKLLMVANPHSAHNPEIMDALYNRIPEMPRSYIIEIEQGGEGISQLEILQGNVSSCQHGLDMAIDNAKGLYRMDYEEGGSIDNMINFVSGLSNLDNQYELAALYLEKGDIQNMDNTLNNIRPNNELNAAQLVDYINWQSYFNIAKVLRTSEIKQGALRANQKAILQAMVEANANTAPASAALALLLFDNPYYDYVEEVKTFEPNIERRAAPSSNPINELALDNAINIYPNPAHDYITLKYKCDNNQLEYIIQDASGKVLIQQVLNTADNEQLINISNLSAGIYSFILYGDGNLIEVKKITVVK